MNWDAYRYFLAVAETGSLSAAARQLSVSQPTVGRQIAELEARVGTRLFDRASHGYRLTVAGNQIFGKVKSISEEIIGVDRQVEGLDKDLSGSVRISATEGFGVYWLTQQIAAIQKKYPHISFELLLDLVVLDARKRETDIAIRLSPSKSQALIGQNVGKIGFGLYGSRSYFEQFGIPKSIESLQGHRFINWHSKDPAFPLSRALKSLVGQQNIVFETDTVSAQKKAVTFGVGLMLAPHYIVPEGKDFMRVLSDEVAISENLWILTHSDLKFTTRIRTVIDGLTEAIKADHEFLEHGIRY